MKKKVVSKEALEAMYAGKKPTEEPAGEPKAEGNLEPEGKEEIVVEPTGEEEVNFEEKFTALSAEFGALKETSEKSVAEAEAKLVEATVSTEKLEASVTSLKDIVAGTLSGMRTALDLAEVDVSDMSAETLVKEFKATEEKFLKSLPSGPVVPEVTGKDEEKDSKVINTITDAAAYASLGFSN